VNAGSIRGLVLIFPGALGDLLLALPTLRALRARHAGPATLVVPEPLRALAGLTGVANRVASLDDASSAWLFGGDTLPPWLEGRPSVHSWLGTRTDLRDRLASVAASVTLLRVERGPGTVHAADAYARAAGLRLGRARSWRDAQVCPAESAMAWRLLGSVPRPLLAVHRGAGAAAKRWSPAAFAAVVARWQAAGGGVVELLGPAEACDAATDGAAAVRDWPLPDVAALLARVDAYVGNDSGVSHLAAAVGAPTVVVFTATPSRRWRPLGAQVRVVRSAGSVDAAHPSVRRVLASLAAMES
jgi:heptosyltransferase-3